MLGNNINVGVFVTSNVLKFRGNDWPAAVIGLPLAFASEIIVVAEEVNAWTSDKEIGFNACGVDVPAGVKERYRRRWS